MDLLSRFLNFNDENQLFEKNERILLAVSGGKDSVLMTHLFAKAGYSFGIAHCNFKLRGESSEMDEALVFNLARQLNVPFYATSFDTEEIARERKMSIEMAARELRYQWFEDLRQQHQYDYVALAHHQNDAIETMLLNLTRGTGIAGLHGILPKRDRFIRPLLFLIREEVEAAIDKWKLTYRDDESNFSTKYTRNKIRLEIIPKLKEINPSLEKTFIENAERFEELNELLKTYTTTLREKLFIARDVNSYTISMEKLQQLHPVRTLLYELFRPFNFTSDVLDDLLSVWTKKNQSGKYFNSVTHSLVMSRKDLILEPLMDQPLQELIPLTPGEQKKFGNFIISAQNSQVEKVEHTFDKIQVDEEELVFPLQIRHWREGDWFKPLGMKGKKKLSDFFISLKIPVTDKMRVPVVVNGNGDVIWVAPYRIDDRYKITDKTKKVVTLECIKWK
ncbi:tRNA lysidine(34) synthetase TilS [Olivibacter domesticus]|uniref:tRNA(Ile)-lysidine synthase n=1 Tax=Olivibacter domesticus TaxID=407022 RepID=A0A1H7VIP3_OLID1|nr:tRNA lysidine(34) synthetase TilS [Olivibacter domesticus]SEM08725.1 tRNA(Ile)-lysidine synthase [Olivibacter domesticus]